MNLTGDSWMSSAIGWPHPTIPSVKDSASRTGFLDLDREGSVDHPYHPMVSWIRTGCVSGFLVFECSTCSKLLSVRWFTVDFMSLFECPHILQQTCICVFCCYISMSFWLTCTCCVAWYAPFLVVNHIPMNIPFISHLESIDCPGISHRSWDYRYPMISSSKN